MSISHLKTYRYDCHRAPKRGKTNPTKPVLRTRKGDCKCYILAKLYAITSNTPQQPDKNSSETTYIAIISANYPHLHAHNLEWGNRCHAPLPKPLINRIKTLAIDNPNYSSFKHMIDRYMTRPEGLRADMKQHMVFDFEPDLNDPCIDCVQDNRIKYQFYKAIDRVSGLKKSDQINLKQWIHELKLDKERYHPTDLVHYLPYQDVTDDQTQSTQAQVPIVCAYNKEDPAKPRNMDLQLFLWTLHIQLHHMI